MGQDVAEALLAAVGLYAAFGLAFAVPFLVRLVGRLDRAAARGSVGFRVVVLPGVVALWPLLAWRLRAAREVRPSERRRREREP